MKLLKRFNAWFFKGRIEKKGKLNEHESELLDVYNDNEIIRVAK